MESFLAIHFFPKSISPFLILKVSFSSATAKPNHESREDFYYINGIWFHKPVQN